MLKEEVIGGKTPQKKTSTNNVLTTNEKLKYSKRDDRLMIPNSVDNIIEVLNQIQLSRFNKDNPDVINTFDTFRYYSNSACWPDNDIDSLKDMSINSCSISHKVFKWYVDIDHILLLEKILGCKLDDLQFNMTKAHDEYISYYMSAVHGEIVYFCRYMGIMYIFKKG